MSRKYKTTEMERQSVRRYFSEKVSRGLCGACGKHPLKTKRLCEQCAEKAKNLQQMYRDINKDCGLTARGTPYKKEPAHA